MKKYKFLKSLLSSVMALSVISTTVVPANAEETTAEPGTEETYEETTAEETFTNEFTEEENGGEEFDENEFGGEEGGDDEIIDEDEDPGAGSISFDASDEDLTVTAEAPEGAFPEGTEMTADKNVDEETINLIKGVIGENDEILAAVDITFTSDGNTVQPGEAVKVALAAENITYSENLKIVHVDDKGETPVAEILDQKLIETEDGGVAFEAASFSVYAVVGDGSTDNEARITVNFYGYDSDADTFTTEPVETVFVKNGDDADHLEKIVYDPGVGGKLEHGKLFVGWSLDVTGVESITDKTPYVGAAYVTATTPMTIPEIRTFLMNLEIHEGDELDIYPMIFNVYTVTYEDAKKVALATENVLVSSNETWMPYTVSQSYSATDQTHNFEGWNPIEGSTNIRNAKYEGEDKSAPYKQGTTMEISGDIKFSTEVSEGHWLVFEENGYGATYNAPIFIKSTEGTREPALAMTRSGYTFGGWYKLKDGVNLTSVPKDADGYYIIDDTYFDDYTDHFGETLDDRLVLYAKWNVADKAKYTVIVWRQSVVDDKAAADADKTYDFAFAVELEGTSNESVSGLDLSTYQSYAGKTYSEDISFVGFEYNTVKTVADDSDYKAIGNGVIANYDKIQPNGTTVIHLYYDRKLVTYEFYVPGDNYTQVTGTPSWGSQTYYVRFGNGTTYYPVRGWNNTYSLCEWEDGPSNNDGYTYVVIVGNTIYQLTRVQRGNFWNTYYDWRYTVNGTYYYLSETGATAYRLITNSNTTFYTRSFTLRETYTGLYDQKLSKYDYSWPGDYRWLVGPPEEATSFMSISEKFLNWEGKESYVTRFYGTSITVNAYVYHYLENLDGSWPSTANHTVPTNTSSGMLFREFAGFTEKEFRVKLPDGVTTYRLVSAISDSGDLTYDGDTKTSNTGWTEWIPANRTLVFGDFTPDDMNHIYPLGGAIEYRYSRDKYDLTYMAGVFVDRDGKQLTPPLSGKLKEEADILYESDLKDYAKTGANYYNPDTANPQTGFVFLGWYNDEKCTEPFDFSKSTMPLNGKIVYGKWQQIEYRVFLHSNAFLDENQTQRDSTLTWGSESQGTSFRISYNQKVSVPTGRRIGYEFIGWYTDSDFTNAYSADTKLTDSTVPAEPVYDKEKDMTDGASGNGLDKWGLVPEGDEPGINKDTDRSWITRKLDLYAKWSANLDGADGIGVIYNVNGGSNQPNDDRLYKDNVTAVAQTASTPPTADQQFKYWVLQTWDPTANDGQGGYVDIPNSVIYPGESYRVLKENARIVVSEYESDGVTPKVATYTIQLRAEYGPKDTPTPTHIYWYSNLRSIADTENTFDISKIKTTITSTNATDGAVAGTDDASKGKMVEYRKLMKINEAIPILDATTFDVPGYAFIGWAKDPAAKKEDDLFLKWTGSAWQAKINGNWTNVTQVAADEIEPYEDMYAIWEVGYSIRFSSTMEVKSYRMPKDGETVNLIDKMNELGHNATHLYGGYYVDPGKDNLPDGGKAYIGQDDYWTGLTSYEPTMTGEVFPGIGTAMTPTAGKTYFLKEVPDYYITPMTEYFYNHNYGDILTRLYLITNLDDKRYSEVGFTRFVEEKHEGLTDTVYSYTNGQNSKQVLIPIKATNVFKKISFKTALTPDTADAKEVAEPFMKNRTFTGTGRVAYADVRELGKAYTGIYNQSVILYDYKDIKFNYIPYVVTNDGVKVYGKYVRRVDCGSGYLYDGVVDGVQSRGIHLLAADEDISGLGYSFVEQ